LPALALGLAAQLPLSEARAQGADDSFAARLVNAALLHRVAYDGSYQRIPHPGGDVPADAGVCSDVVIRAYRRRASICSNGCTRTRPIRSSKELVGARAVPSEAAGGAAARSQ
jgi:hypothetical protein